MTEPRRPRVAYVLKMFPRFSETFVLSELLELERQGVDLRVLSLRRPDDGIVHADLGRLRAPVVYLPEPRRRASRRLVGAQAGALARAPHAYARLAARAVRRRSAGTLAHILQAAAAAGYLRRERVEHLHAHFASTASSVALHAHRLTGIPFSLTAHAKDIYADGVSQADLARKLEAARFAVTVSDFNARHLAAVAPAARLVRIYNGLDLVQFAQNGRHPESPPLVLGVGRLVEKKGFDDLVRACARLRHEGIDLRCAIVGKGALEGELRRLIAELGVADSVELAGPVPRERLRVLYGRAAVVAAPCVVGGDGNRDGLPTVLIEAMALGVPVVSTGVTGIPELVRDGQTGLLVPQRDPQALAAAIRSTLEDGDAARGRAARARALVEAEFDARRNVAALRRLLVEAA